MAALLENVLLVIVAWPLIAPPLPVAVLFVNVLASSVNGALLKFSIAPPPPPSAVLFSKAERFTTRLLSPANISIAPPSNGDFPLRNVRSLNVTGVLTPTFWVMNRMRKSGVAAALDRSMIVVLAAAP